MSDITSHHHHHIEHHLEHQIIRSSRIILLMLLTFTTTATRGVIAASVEVSRINSPCAGGNPAVVDYPVRSTEQVLIGDQLPQSYFVVSRSITYIDWLLAEYQFLCLRRTYERLAKDITMIETILQAEANYELMSNTSLSYQMNRLREMMYTLLCDLANVSEKKNIKLPNLIARHDDSVFLRDLERFQRDYAAFLCVRTSLRQVRDDLSRPNMVGFYA